MVKRRTEINWLNGKRSLILVGSADFKDKFLIWSLRLSERLDRGKGRRLSYPAENDLVDENM